MNTYLKASTNPVDDLNAVAYEGQPLENRMYKSGYEDYFELLPLLSDEDPHLDFKISSSKLVMNLLANELEADKWTSTLRPIDGGFNRTVLAIEPPIVNHKSGLKKEGREIVVARWGHGKSSPVHGHTDGLLYETLLFGSMRVNTYRIIDHEKRIARPVETKIYNGFSNIAASYTRKQEYTRSALVHNFTSIGYSASLHYVPEHTRDGRDNGFNVQYFEQTSPRLSSDYLWQLNAKEGLERLLPGDVALVRSENVPDYGDHWIVITGKPVLKQHGLRPQDIAIHAPHASRLLDAFKPIMGLTLLKLDDDMKKDFYDFHGIMKVDGEIIFPTA